MHARARVVSADTSPTLMSREERTTESRKRYKVFISYSHLDAKWAKWLMRRIEGYRVPRRFHGRLAPIGETGSRIAPVFRDRDELPTTSDLGATIREALRQSATLVVICSPRSAQSRWVQEEIISFKRIHGERHVFAFIVDGEPNRAGGVDDCFSPALRAEVGNDGALSNRPVEVVAADARKETDGPKVAFVRLLAGLLGVGFDELRQRELQRRNRRLRLIAAGSVAGMVAMLALAIVAWQSKSEALLSRNDALRRQQQAEDVLTFMLGDFRADLKKVGQLGLLDKVGNKAMVYFDALDPRDLTEVAMARQAKALTQIGEIRLEQKDARFADAGHAFFLAYQRAAALAARHPDDGDMIFERAQAEFWIGNTFLSRGELEPAVTWFDRYVHSAEKLVSLDPTNPKWMRELISGQHNRAALDSERGRLAAAQEGFLTERDRVARLSASDGRDLSLQFKLTDIDSFLGSIAERAGDYAEAFRRFEAQQSGLEGLIAAEPQSAQWSYRLADCLYWQAELLAITGRTAEARDRLASGNRLLAKLLAHDPTNRRWLGLGAIFEMQLASLEAPTASLQAGQRLSGARATLEKLTAAEPGDRLNAQRLMKALRLQAQAEMAAGRNGEARTAAERALAIAHTLLNERRMNDRILGSVVLCFITAGQIDRALQQAAAGGEHFRRASELLLARVATSNDWCLLEPAARVWRESGRGEESRELIEKLTRLGFVPVDPWQSPKQTSDFRSATKTSEP